MNGCAGQDGWTATPSAPRSPSKLMFDTRWTRRSKLVCRLRKRSHPVFRSRYTSRPFGVNVKPTGFARLPATRTARAPVAAIAGGAAVPANAAMNTDTVAAAIPILRMSSTPSAASIGAVATAPPSMFGVPVLRSEDPRFLRGEGRYLENLEIPDPLHAVFVRSIMPHAQVGAVDV